MKEISKEMATHLFYKFKEREERGCVLVPSVHTLNANGTDNIVTSIEDIEDHDFIFGVEDGEN
jgi:hypothetical protein